MSLTPPPVPGAPLDYAETGNVRPVMLTTVAVMSIIVASLSALVSLGRIVASVMFMTLAPTATLAPTTSAAASAGAVSAGARVATTTRITRVPLNVRSTMSVWSLSESALNLIAAVILFIGGTLLLIGDSRKSRSLHWVYVWMKIPLALVAAVIGWIAISGVMSAMSTGAPAAGARVGAGVPSPALLGVYMVAPAVMGLALALAYPVALIFLLCSPRLKPFWDLAAPPRQRS